VLVYAHRADEQVHSSYKTWLEQLVNSRAPFALSVLVAVGFLRAQHAAVAIAEGGTWVTRNADFGRFASHGLRWEHLSLSTG
jgi:predicted nucleic acid-binding protein